MARERIHVQTGAGRSSSLNLHLAEAPGVGVLRPRLYTAVPMVSIEITAWNQLFEARSGLSPCGDSLHEACA